MKLKIVPETLAEDQHFIIAQCHTHAYTCPDSFVANTANCSYLSFFPLVISKVYLDGYTFICLSVSAQKCLNSSIAFKLLVVSQYLHHRSFRASLQYIQAWNKIYSLFSQKLQVVTMKIIQILGYNALFASNSFTEKNQCTFLSLIACYFLAC